MKIIKNINIRKKYKTFLLAIILASIVICIIYNIHSFISFEEKYQIYSLKCSEDNEGLLERKKGIASLTDASPHAVRYCPKCGKSAYEIAKVTTRPGYYCPKCKKLYKEKHSYCPKCGEKLEHIKEKEVKVSDVLSKLQFKLEY